MSVIRLWKLGRLTDDPNTSLIPTKAMLDKFKELLESNNNGIMDLVWGPEVECQIISTETVDKILIPVKVEDGEVLYKVAK